MANENRERKDLPSSPVEAQDAAKKPAEQPVKKVEVKTGIRAGNEGGEPSASW